MSSTTGSFPAVNIECQKVVGTMDIRVEHGFYLFEVHGSENDEVRFIIGENAFVELRCLGSGCLKVYNSLNSQLKLIGGGECKIRLDCSGASITRVEINESCCLLAETSLMSFLSLSVDNEQEHDLNLNDGAACFLWAKQGKINLHAAGKTYSRVIQGEGARVLEIFGDNAIIR